MSGPDLRLVIGLCTFRRPGLALTLASLARTTPPGLVRALIIADNDDTPSAEALVKATDCPFPITYLHAPARNISVARNAVLDEAQAQGAGMIAFLDDDEEAVPGWLPALLHQMQATGAAAVIGPVRAIYLPDAPHWMQEGQVHDTLPVLDQTGTPVSGYTCNTLLDMDNPALRGLRFDISRGRTGGEDTAFFHRIRQAGGQIAYAPDAVLIEEVPPARARLGWLLQRRFRMGQTHGSLIADNQPPYLRLWQAFVATLKALTCLGLAAVGALSGLRRNRALMRMALHLGVVWQLAGGRRVEPYGGPALTTKTTIHPQPGRHLP